VIHTVPAGWLEIDADAFAVYDVYPKPVTVTIGDATFRAEQRKRRAGKYIDNAFSGFRETWLLQNEIELGWLDTVYFQPSGMSMMSDAANWPDRDEVGEPTVVGNIGSLDVVIRRPDWHLWRRLRKVPITLGGRELVLDGSGFLSDGTQNLAQLKGRHPSVAGDADAAVVYLSALLVVVRVKELVTTRFNENGASPIEPY